MKDIKSYVIGFLTCACLFLVMGQTKSDNQIGRYQISTIYAGGTLYGYIFETTLDTKTGEIVKRGKTSNEDKKNIESD